MGGYLSSLYACQHPERIKALFCASTAGYETYDPANYKPGKYPDFDEPSKPLHPKLVESSLRREDRKTHPMLVLTKLKPEVAASILENNCRAQILREDVSHPASEAQAQAIVDYQVLMFSHLSCLEIVEVMPLKYPFLVRHPMTASDMFGSPRVRFPVGHAFGDKDFFGSEGADDVVRQSPEFATGRS